MTFKVATDFIVETLPYQADLGAWFERIRHKPQPMLLSSGGSTHPAARFDILTADPQMVLRTHAGITSVTDKTTDKTRNSTESPFALLAHHCPLIPVAANADIPFTGGVIAWFGYELLHDSNKLPTKAVANLQVPNMLAGIFDWALILDHHLQRASLVLRSDDPARRAEIRAWLQQSPTSPHKTAFNLKTAFTSNYTQAEYLTRFQRIIDYIHAGDCYQVNLAQCFTATCSGDSWDAFSKLQSRANAPFAAYLEDGRHQVLSFSPERFLKVDAGVVTTQPIKGTRPRSQDPEQDQRNQVELETSTKDRAENLMIVDLLRNDLGRICEFGSVKVDKLFELQSFSNVHHLVSTISGRLQKPEDVFALLPACFPGGSITGTPKLRAMQIIDELETMPRSVYCGVIAWIDHSGNMDSNIEIRTLVRDGENIHCWGGGGIVADSVGTEEYQETFDKIGFFINNI
jgi:para-aminobenzoate synthetase component I